MKISEFFQEKNINEPCADQPLKVQSVRIPAEPAPCVDDKGRPAEVGPADGGIEGDRFIEQFRDDPPTH